MGSQLHQIRIFFLTLGLILFGVTGSALAAGAGGDDNSQQDFLPPAAAHGKADLRDQNNNRTADSLDQSLAAGADGATVSVKVLLRAGASSDGLTTAIGKFAKSYDFTYLNGFVAELNHGQIRALQSNPNVEWIEPVYPVSGSAESSRDEVGITAMEANPVFAGIDGSGVNVCLIDSGVRTGHQQFAVAGKFGGYLNAITDVEGDPTAVGDGADHGTMVAALIAGTGNGSAFAAPLRGMAPGATLYVVKALGSGLTGLDADVLKGMEWCIGQGVDVINLSILGDASATINPADSMTRLVSIATQKGIVVVGGAGNGELGTTYSHTPGAAPLAISVGAYVGSEKNDEARAAAGSDFLRNLLLDLSELFGIRPAPFATRTGTTYGMLKPDLSAPGHGIVSASSAGDNQYNTNSGTSFSTPIVSGIVALMLQANPNLTPDDVRNILYETAQDAGYLVNGAAAKDHEWGFGRADAQAAVARALNLGSMPSNFHQHVAAGFADVFQNQTTSFYFEVPEYNAGILNVAVHSPRDGGLKQSCTIFGCTLQTAPDIDIQLYYDPVGGTEQFVGDSICPAAGLDCAALGYQESIAVYDVDAGRYRVDLIWLPNTAPPNYTQGQIHYDVIWGPLVPGTRPAMANGAPTADAGSDIAATATDVQLDASASSDPDAGGSIIYYVWSWGENGFAEGVNPLVTLPDMTTTEVTLTVVDNLGYSATDTVAVTVDSSGSGGENLPPVAMATSDQPVQASGNGRNAAGLVNLDGSGSTDPDGDETIVAWNWSSSSGAASSGETASLSLPKGTHTVTLTVIDDQGASDSVDICVEVYNKNPEYTCGSEPPPPSGDTGTITGKTKSGKKNAAGILVTVTNGSDSFQQTTGKNGQFSFPNLSLGTWTLSGGGCAAVPPIVLDSAGQTVTQDLAC